MARYYLSTNKNDGERKRYKQKEGERYINKRVKIKLPEREKKK